MTLARAFPLLLVLSVACVRAGAAGQASQEEEALRSIDGRLASEPGNPRLWAARGVVLERLSRKRESLESFDKALSISPKFLPALEGAAQVAYETRSPRAADLLRRILEQAPDNATAHAMAGALAFEARRCEEAAAHFARAGREIERSPVALAQFGECLVETRRAGEAVPVFERALALRPGNAAVRYNLGLAQFQLGCYDAARATLEPLTSSDAGALNLSAAASEAAGKIPEAVAALRKATGIAPRDERNYVDLARLCLDHGSYDLALEVASGGIRNIPASAALYTLRGSIYAQLAQLEKAQADFERANTQEPDKLYGSVGLSLLWRQVNRGDEAIALLRKRLARTPRDPILNYLLADSLIREGAQPRDAAFREAVKALELAVRIKPDFLKARSALGKLYCQENETAKGVEQLQVALRGGSGDRAALNQLVLALRQLGRKEESAKMAARLRVQLQQEQRAEVARNRVRLVRASPASAGPNP